VNRPLFLAKAPPICVSGEGSSSATRSNGDVYWFLGTIIIWLAGKIAPSPVRGDVLSKRIVVGIFSLAVCFAVAGWLVAADKPKAAADDNPFEGKLLAITWSRDRADGQTLMKDPKVKRIGDRPFVVGQQVGREGGTLWFAADRILTIEEFATAKDFEKRYGSSVVGGSSPAPQRSQRERRAAGSPGRTPGPASSRALGYSTFFTVRGSAPPPSGLRRWAGRWIDRSAARPGYISARPGSRHRTAPIARR
jgi:hypothetical protein